MRAIRLLASGLFCFSVLPSLAVPLAEENFEAQPTGTKIGDFGPGWNSITALFTAGNQAGLAANGSGYLDAPSRTGAGDRQRYAWLDVSSAFNARGAGNDLIVETVKMFIPEVTSSTYGGMVMFDQFGDVVATIGVDMLTGRTLTDATTGVSNVQALLGQYNDIELLADYGTGVVDYFFNGSQIGSTQMSASSRFTGLGDFDFYNNGFNATTSVAFRYDDYAVQAIPEPATVTLLGLGLAGLAALRRHKGASKGAC